VSNSKRVTGLPARIAETMLETGRGYSDLLLHDQYLTDEMNIDRLRKEAMALSMGAGTILKIRSLSLKRRRTAEAIFQRAVAELRTIYSPLRGNDLNNRANMFERARIRLDRIVRYSTQM